MVCLRHGELEIFSQNCVSPWVIWICGSGHQNSEWGLSDLIICWFYAFFFFFHYCWFIRKDTRKEANEEPNEEMHRTSYRRRHPVLPCALWCNALPSPPCVQQPGNSPSPVLWGIMEALLHRHDGLSHWPLVIHLLNASIGCKTEDESRMVYHQGHNWFNVLYLLTLKLEPNKAYQTSTSSTFTQTSYWNRAFTLTALWDLWSGWLVYLSRSSQPLTGRGPCRCLGAGARMSASGCQQEQNSVRPCSSIWGVPLTPGPPKGVCYSVLF